MINIGFLLDNLLLPRFSRNDLCDCSDFYGVSVINSRCIISIGFLGIFFIFNQNIILEKI